MAPIPFTAEAGLDVTRELDSGNLEVAGLLVREAASKRIRYLLSGFENLPADPERLRDLPPLQALEGAIGMTQVLRTITIAQNAAMAQTQLKPSKALSCNHCGPPQSVGSEQPFGRPTLRDSATTRLR
jgi:hypothetical protein